MKTKLALLFIPVLAFVAWIAVHGVSAATEPGPHIAYTSPDHNIWTMSYNGTDKSQLTTDLQSDNAAWSPDRRSVVFQSLRDGKTFNVQGKTLPVSQIYTMGYDGSGQTRVSDGNWDDKYPDSSSNQNRIVFIRVGNYRESDGKVLHDTQIGSMNYNGGDYRALATLTSDSTTTYDQYPARQNADGSKIVFVKRVIGQSNQLMLLTVASGNVGVLGVNGDGNTVPGSVEYLWPRFAPNGDIVALRREGVYGPSNVALLRIAQDGRVVGSIASGLTYEALAGGFDIDWGSNVVVGSRLPDLPGGVRPEEIYLLNASSGAADAPFGSGHAPAIVASLPITPTNTPTPSPTNTPTNTPIPTNTPLPTNTPIPGVTPPTATPTLRPGEATYTPTPTPTPSKPLIDTASPLFYSVWERTDRAVVENQAQRSWTWGPQPFASLQEPFDGGGRLVQYFDKARMELNPAANGNPAYVTNGLLVVELLSGKVQTGANQYEQRTPADLPIGGDGDGNPSPSYAALAKVSSLSGENQAQSAINSPVTAGLNGNGAVSDVGAIAPVTIAQFAPQTGHNIPNVFWDFLNQQGTIFVDGRYQQGQVFDWVFTVGYPLSEPYWTRINIAGQTTDVLVQAYQRQILTYIPSYDAPWRVQFGNVGQIYYKWRYGGQ